MSTALERTFSFSDASVNVSMPSNGMSETPSSEQSHIFLRSPAPALHIVKIRQILSAGYQDMYYGSREPSLQPLVQVWTLCYKTREWYHQCPKNVPSHFPLLYRLELLYTIIMLLSPSNRYPVPCDYNKAVLFDRCMDYISQIHQVLENPTALPFLTYLDIQRVHQVARRFIEVLSHNLDLLLTPSVPVPPPVPAGTPNPPLLDTEDRVSCRPRARRCLTYVAELLRYCEEKWNVRDPLDEFERDSAALMDLLAGSPQAHLSDSYVKASSSVPLAGPGYSGYILG